MIFISSPRPPRYDGLFCYAHFRGTIFFIFVFLGLDSSWQVLQAFLLIAVPSLGSVICQQLSALLLLPNRIQSLFTEKTMDSPVDLSHLLLVKELSPRYQSRAQGKRLFRPLVVQHVIAAKIKGCVVIVPNLCYKLGSVLRLVSGKYNVIKF